MFTDKNCLLWPSKSIIFPLRYSEDGKYVTLEIFLCWVLGAIIGFLPFVWHKNLPITRCFYHDVVTEGYQMFRFVFVIIIPACIIFTIYGMIYKIVLHQVGYFWILLKSCVNNFLSFSVETWKTVPASSLLFSQAQWISTVHSCRNKKGNQSDC